MTLTVPPGWTVQRDGKTVQLDRKFPEAKDERGEGIGAIRIIGPATEPPARFDANFMSVVNALPELAEEDPIVEADGQTPQGHRLRIDDRCCMRREGVSFSQIVAGFGAGRKQVFIHMMQANLRGDNAAQADADFAALVRSVRVRPRDAAFALVPKPGDGGLEGVFSRLETGLRPNVFGGMDFYAENHVLVLDPGGLFSTELPTGGQSLTRHCAQAPQDCGLYAVQGKRIQMRSVINDYGVMQTETTPFAQTRDGLTIDGQDHRRIPPVGPVLDGEWNYTFASSGTMAGSSGSIAVERTLILRPDGTFRRQGWSGASTSNDMGSGTSGVTTSSRRPLEQGRYTISDYVLTLRGADGSTETLGIFAPDVGSDALLVINGANYLKQE